MVLSNLKCRRTRLRNATNLLPAALLLAVLPALLGLTFTLESSTVTYTARDSRSEWEGVAPLTSVTLTEAEGAVKVEAVLEPGEFSSGNFARDGNARYTVFDTSEFPTATLTGSLPLTVLKPDATDATMNGTLTLHGVTHDVAFPVQVTRDDAQITATGSFDVLLSDYEMKRPNLFGVVVDDQVDLSVSLTGTLAP